jgi:ankyrin repeat protein
MYDDVAFPKPGITILIRALFRTNFNCCDQLLANLQKLIASGVDVNEADDSGWTPLMYAVRLTYDGRIKQALLDAHADVNRSSLRGDTALILSAWSGVLETDLLARGARINAHNLDGVTPLMLLAQRGDPKALKAALAAGADANAKDNTGRTALDYLRAAACHTPIIPLEPAAPEYDDDGNPKPPRVWPCPSTDPGAVQDEAILRAAMHSQSAR